MACLSTETADKALSLLLADTRIPETVIYDIEEPKHILAREAERLEKVASAFQDHVRRRVSFIHRQQNSLIPLYRLPDELLVEIFNISRREPLVWGFNKYRVLLRLAAVSSRWRTVALSFPGLWDNLSNRLSIEATALMLDRSRQAPLKLSCLFQNDRCAHWFFKLTLPQMTRWKSLEMDSRCLNRNTSDILTGELHLPRLEDLVIYNPSDGDFEVPLNISAPSLQTLSSQYYQFPLRLEPGLHSKLVKLNFLACWDGIPFFPEHYYTLLSSATNLEEVSIHGYNSDSYPKPDIHNFMEIHLPKLKRLHLNELPFRTIGFLLSSISTPSDCYPNIKISGKSYGAFPDMFLNPCARNSLSMAISDSHWAHVAEKHDIEDQIFLTINTKIDVMGVTKSVLDLQLERNYAGLRKTLPVFMGGGWFAQLKYLKITGLVFFQDRHVGPSLQLLPYLEDLVIGSYDEDSVGHDCLSLALMALASTDPVGTCGSQRCPRLRRVAFDTFWVDVEPLVQLITSRTLEAASASHVRPLELVELSDNIEYEEFEIQQLEEISAERNVELQFFDYQYSLSVL